MNLQLLDTLLEYKELVQRPRIRRDLETEGQALMNYTKSWLHKLRVDLVSTKAKSSKSDVPDTLAEINAIRLLETQVCLISQCCPNIKS